MIDLIAGYARGYNRDQIRPFLKSLRANGYRERILLFADGSAAAEARKWDVDLRPVPRTHMKVHSARFLPLEEAIKEIDAQGVMVADTRDIIFQRDPSVVLPDEGLNAFEEDRSQTIGSCPYNSEWIRLAYGEGTLEELSHLPISCVGTTCGDAASMRGYLSILRGAVEKIQPRTHKPQDQAVHNYLVHKMLPAKVWNNEEGEIYTVGYIKRGSVKIKDGKIINLVGATPTVIHQWDRHANLKRLVLEKWA